MDQSLIQAKEAWNSLAGQFFRRWSTGKLPNPGLHRGFSTAHRLNSQQIRGIIEKVEAETNTPMSKWNAEDVEKAVEEVKAAGRETGDFLAHIAENNPTARTVALDVKDVFAAAQGAFQRIQASPVTQEVEGAAGAVVEDVHEACQATGEPC